jgi:hypothetical protein
VYKIVIELENVAEGDATTLAQDIWDEHAEGLDADRGEFKVSISRDGFPVEWTPAELA